MMSPDGSITLTNGISGSTSTSSSTSVHASITLPSGSSTASKKPVDGGGGGITAGGGAPTSAGGSGTLPRVDLEPIYDALRAGLTLEQWIRYKEGLAGFVMGECCFGYTASCDSHAKLRIYRTYQPSGIIYDY